MLVDYLGGAGDATQGIAPFPSSRGNFEPILSEILQRTLQVLYGELVQTTPEGLKSNFSPFSKE